MKGRHLLSAKSVAALKEPGRYADGGGLYLLIRQRGSIERLWVFRYKRGGRGEERETMLSLGAARDVSLADARAKAEVCRSALAAGRDPKLALSRTGRVRTFGEVADDLISDLKPGFKSAKHAAQWEMTLGNTYCSKLRLKPIDAITTDDIMGVLKPIWLAKPETASRIRGRIERVLDSAKAHHYRDGDNPARWRGHLSLLLPTQGAGRGHHRALPWKEVPAFMARLRGLQSVSALALEWTILTAARTNEAVGTPVSEIDAQERVWTIPAARMKGRLKATRDHRVPLCDRAMEIYTEASKIGSAWLFPSTDLDRHLSLSAMAECLKGLDVPATVHGFRSTFRDWAHEATAYPEALAEQALAHVVKSKTERAYKRGDALERRRELMAAWEKYLTHTASVVVLKRG